MGEAESKKERENDKMYWKQALLDVKRNEMIDSKAKADLNSQEAYIHNVSCMSMLYNDELLLEVSKTDAAKHHKYFKDRLGLVLKEYLSKHNILIQKFNFAYNHKKEKNLGKFAEEIFNLSITYDRLMNGITDEYRNYVEDLAEKKRRATNSKYNKLLSRQYKSQSKSCYLKPAK